jgi:hypothetical protein
VRIDLDGSVWRVALLAVPENRRGEILCTLSDVYGQRTSAREAYRTVTSGVRMRNRQMAATPADLWRIGARNAFVFMVVGFGTTTLGRSLSPVRWESLPNVLSWEKWAAVAMIVAAACVSTGRCHRSAAVVVASWSAGYTLGVDWMHRSIPFHQIQWWRWAGAGLVVGVSSLLIVTKAVRMSPLKLLLVTVSLAALSIAPHIQSIRRVQPTAFNNASMGLGLVSLLLWSRSTRPRSAAGATWPVVLALTVGALSSLANADTGAHNGIVATAAATIFVGLALVSVVVAAIRPQLLISLTCYLVLSVIVGFGSDGPGTQILVQLLVCVGLVAVGRFVSKRALVV